MSQSRRQFLQVLGTLGLGGIVAACGGSTAAPSSAPPSVGAPAAPKPAQAGVAAASSAASGSAAPASSPAAAASTAARLSGGAGASAGGQLIPIVGAQGATVAVSSPMWMADYLKLFEKHGVAFTLKNIASTATIPAMLNKEADVQFTSAAPMLTANLNGKVDMVYIAAYVTHQTVSLWVDPSIKTAADLKGKTVATDRPGTPGDFNTRQALDVAGLNPSDVKLVPLGSSNVNVQAMLSGQVQAAVVPPPFSFQLEAKGFKSLADAWSKPNVTNGAVVLRSRLDELAPALQGLVAALREGVIAFDQQPDVAMKAIAFYTKEQNMEVVQKTYDFFHTKVKFDVSLRTSLEGLQQMLDFLSETVPAAKTAKPERFVDNRFVDKLPPL